jgi:23S rRNA (cytidine1920-2'-O)/16S rRNA (cytidine1409-2'-O)-methyltransferase
LSRRPLEQVLVARHLANSREESLDLIEAGRVLVGGSVALNAQRLVADAEAVVVEEPTSRYVSRGGEKLEGALSRLNISVEGRTVIDAGSATGGFTDCLLQHGARAVVAVDVGYGQLHEQLRIDPRVLSCERTNIRNLDRDRLMELCGPTNVPDLLTADLSFTPLSEHIAHFVELLGRSGEMLVMCKPQFELEAEEVSKTKGVVRDPARRRAAIEHVVAALATSGTAVAGVVESPILGPAGNAEFFIYATFGTIGDAIDIERQVDEAIDRAGVLR